MNDPPDFAKNKTALFTANGLPTSFSKYLVWHLFNSCFFVVELKLTNR